ncbi:MAG: phosphatase PAP2 family protein [Anaerolineales bacterium]|nr:phosphatase PAP2 family protein [Anaerolineales bacterium]
MIHQLIGVGLFLVGCLHIIKPIQDNEVQIVKALQELFNRKPWLSLFREIWFFGRTSFTLIVIILLICIDWKTGLIADLVFFIIVGIEQLIKQLFHRVRPFSVHTSIAMLQPLEPHDSSFPSGDALRVWYIALILPMAAGNSIPFLIGTITLALFVSLGRIVLGVHYLTDTLAGIGLGLLGAGTTIWLWHFFNLLY